MANQTLPGPFAHRAHITLEELKLPFEEVIIDLDKPREPWYLKVNPVCLALFRLLSSTEALG